jgi:serine/threonine protein kinase
MELARGGELMEHVQKEGRLTEQHARKILIQIVNAI